MPRPALTRSRIVVAGVAVVSEVGLPALDLRAVARRVNTTATGVQRHIGATELVESVVDEIVQSMPPMPGRGDWSRRVRLWAVQTRAWLVGYPGLARHLLVDRWHAVGLDQLEDVAGVLDETGLARTQRVMAASTLYRFVLCSADLDESTQVLGGELPAGRVADLEGPAAGVDRPGGRSSRYRHRPELRVRSGPLDRRDRVPFRRRTGRSGRGPAVLRLLGTDLTAPSQRDHRGAAGASGRVHLASVRCPEGVPWRGGPLPTQTHPRRRTVSSASCSRAFAARPTLRRPGHGSAARWSTRCRRWPQ